MREVNITELRNNLPKYISNVQKGHEIRVTSHGHVVARILPPTDTQKEAQEYLKKIRKDCTVGDIISPIDEHWDAEDGHS